jgi:hypothetical protein
MVARLLSIVVFVLVSLTVPARAGADCGPLDCEVDSESESSAIVGRGGLILPVSFVSETTTRGDAAVCATCEWMLVPMCSHSEVPDSVCAGATAGCPPEQLRERVLRRAAPGGAWQRVGLVCVGGDSRPVLVADVAEQVRDRFVDRLPRPEPRFQPAEGGLTNLPVVFRSGQRDGVRSDDFELLGLPVQVDASPRWTWRWGDGSPPLRTTDAGSRWPDTEVSHRYTAAGRYGVTVVAAWSGTFTVDGLGPFDVEGGPVTQEAELDVVVRDAPAELVGD